MEGLRFLVHNHVLRTFLTVAALGNLLIAPLAGVILPVYAREIFESATSLGGMTAAYGLGGLAGAALVAIVAKRGRRRTRYVVAWAVYPLICATLIPLPALPVVMVILCAIGLVAGAVAPVEQSVRQEQTPPELRARVFAAMMAVLALMIPLGTLAGGLIIEAGGLRTILIVFAVGNALLAAGVITARATREL